MGRAFNQWSSLRAQLRLHEDERLYPYPDQYGNITIGVGHNLTANGISQGISSQLLDDDILRTLAELRRAFDWFNALDDIRQRVLIDMCFNMGLPGLLTFTRMLSAIKVHDFIAASHEMLASKWAIQVGERATRLARMMATGIDYTLDFGQEGI